MELFPNFAEWHKAKLDEFVNESTPDLLDLRGIIAKLGVVPLMFDMSGCYAICTNGEIVSFLYDDWQELQVESDPRTLNVALFQGSRKYPELSALIPSKSDDAVECPHCDGTGVVKFAAEHGLNYLVCYCGGLGWLPPGAIDFLQMENSE